MRATKSILLLFLPLLIVVFSACEKSSDNTVMMAQRCMDAAKTTADANGCYTMVDGISDQKASLIRCSALFMMNGITQSTFQSAFKSMSDANKGGQNLNPSVALMSMIAFSSTSTAATVLSECQASGSSGLIMLAALASTATTLEAAISAASASLGNLLGGKSIGQVDAATLQTAISTVANDSTKLAQVMTTENAPVVGAAAIAAQSAYCGASSGNSTRSVCTDLNNAVTSSNGDASAIGKAVLAQYAKTK